MPCAGSWCWFLDLSPCMHRCMHRCLHNGVRMLGLPNIQYPVPRTAQWQYPISWASRRPISNIRISGIMGRGPARPRTRSRPVPVRPRRPAPAAGGPGPPGYHVTRAFGALLRSSAGSFDPMGDSTTTYDHHYVLGLGPGGSTDCPAPLRTFVELPRLPSTPIWSQFPIDVRC